MQEGHESHQFILIEVPNETALPDTTEVSWLGSVELNLIINLKIQLF